MSETGHFLLIINHVLKGISHKTNFVTSLDLNGLVYISIGHFFSYIGHCQHRLRQAASHKETQSSYSDCNR